MLWDKEAQIKPLRMSQQGHPFMMKYGAPIVRSLVTPKKLVGNSLEINLKEYAEMVVLRVDNREDRLTWLMQKVILMRIPIQVA